MTTGEMAAKLFPLLFNMMGPIGVIPAFAGLTATMDQATRVSMARRASALAFLSLVVAVFLGASMLDAWSISAGSLILAGGLIVSLTALLPLVWNPGSSPPTAQGEKRTPEQLAVSPLAFPTIVNPRAVAILVIFVAFFPTLSGRLAVLVVAGLMLVLNLVGMRYAHWFMQRVGMTPLLILGAVFGVLQVALGVEMLVDGWRLLSVQ